MKRRLFNPPEFRKGFPEDIYFSETFFFDLFREIYSQENTHCFLSIFNIQFINIFILIKITLYICTRKQCTGNQMLKNITFSADKELIYKARLKAQKEHTTLNEQFRN